MVARATDNRTTAVADALHSAAIHLLRGVRQEDERSGIGPARLSALSVLVFAGPMRLSDLARIEQVKPPTMTRVIGGLEDAGLVRRHQDSADARAFRVQATNRGIRLLQKGRRRRVARLADALRGLNLEEVELLGRAATIIEQISARL